MGENFAQELIHLMKAGTENTFRSISMLQEQNEKMLKMVMNQGQAWQDEGKKFVDQWMIAAKEQQENFHKTLQEQLDKLEQYAETKNV